MFIPSLCCFRNTQGANKNNPITAVPTSPAQKPKDSTTEFSSTNNRDEIFDKTLLDAVINVKIWGSPIQKRIFNPLIEDRDFIKASKNEKIKKLDKFLNEKYESNVEVVRDIKEGLVQNFVKSDFHKKQCNNKGACCKPGGPLDRSKLTNRV